MSIATDEDGVKTFCGDCIEVMAEIPENSVDMVLCDLPYGTTRNKWDTIIPFRRPVVTVEARDAPRSRHRAIWTGAIRQPYENEQPEVVSV